MASATLLDEENTLPPRNVAYRQHDRGPEPTLISFKSALSASIPVVIAPVGVGERGPGEPQKSTEEKSDGQRQGDGFFHCNLLSPDVLANSMPEMQPPLET